MLLNISLSKDAHRASALLKKKKVRKIRTSVNSCTQNLRLHSRCKCYINAGNICPAV